MGHQVPGPRADHRPCAEEFGDHVRCDADEKAVPATEDADARRAGKRASVYTGITFFVLKGEVPSIRQSL